MRTKYFFILGIFSLGVFNSWLFSQPVSGNNTDQTPSMQSIINLEEIDGLNIPTSVNILLNILGEPNKIVMPIKNDFFPWGQWYQWDRSNGETIRALADNYSTTQTSPESEVRFIELRVRENTTVIPTIDDLKLNIATRDDIEKMIPAAKQSMIYERPELNDEKLYFDAIEYKNNGIYTYFFFDANGKLVGVGQATFNIDAAG